MVLEDMWSPTGQRQGHLGGDEVDFRVVGTEEQFKGPFLHNMGFCFTSVV